MNLKGNPINPPSYGEDLFEENELVASYFHRFELFGRFTPHFHYFYELNAVMKGNGTHFVGNKRFTVKPGDIFLIPPYIKHNYVFDDDDFNVFHIIFRNEFFTKYNPILKNVPGFNTFFSIEPYLRIYNKNTNSIISFADDFAEYEKDFERLSSFNPHVDLPEKIEAYALFVITSVCQRLTDHGDDKERDLDSLMYVMRAVEFLQKNYADRLSVEDLAKVANMSKSTFLRHFKRYYEVTPLEYLNEYRVKEAQRLLSETDLSVTTIAQECGFFDSSHFIKNFKKHVGISPAAYRGKSKKPTE